MNEEVSNTQLAVQLARLETKMDQVLCTVRKNSSRIDDLEDFKSKAKGVMAAGALLWTGLAVIGGYVVSWFQHS